MPIEQKTPKIRLLIETFDLTDSNANEIRINNFNSNVESRKMNQIN